MCSLCLGQYNQVENRLKLPKPLDSAIHTVQIPSVHCRGESVQIPAGLLYREAGWVSWEAAGEMQMQISPCSPALGAAQCNDSLAALTLLPELKRLIARHCSVCGHTTDPIFLLQTCGANLCCTTERADGYHCLCVGPWNLLLIKSLLKSLVSVSAIWGYTFYHD